MLFTVLGANGLAVRTAHRKSSADGGTVFINAAIHVCAIHCDTPPILGTCHHAMALRKLTGEAGGNVVPGFQNNHQPAAHRIASRAPRRACYAPAPLSHVGDGNGMGAPEGRHSRDGECLTRGIRERSGQPENSRAERRERQVTCEAHGTSCPCAGCCTAGAELISKTRAQHGRRFRSMVSGSCGPSLGARMNNSPKPLSVAAIHSVYSGKKITSVVEQAKEFKSTNNFARDAQHPGQAPEKTRVEKK